MASLPRGVYPRQWQFADAWHYPAPSAAAVRRYPAIGEAWQRHREAIATTMCALLRPTYIGRLLHLDHPARRHAGDPSFGLFAGTFIAAGSDIGHYCGKLMTESEIDDERELRAQGRYAIDFDLQDFAGLPQLCALVPCLRCRRRRRRA